MCLLLTLNVIKKQCFSFSLSLSLSLENTFLKQPKGNYQIDPSPSLYRVKSLLQIFLKLNVIVYAYNDYWGNQFVAIY